MPLGQDALAGLYQLDTLFLTLRRALVPDAEGVPIPGAPIEDVSEAYWRVRGALPEGTEELVNGTEEYPHNVLLLVGPDGGAVVHLAAIEVAEADLALLAVFADALDRAAGPRPGPEFEALTEALGELGWKPAYQWLLEGDEATVARWVRRALSPVLHSPFKGPRGAADHEMLSAVLRHAEGWDSIKVNQDEEEVVGRVMLSLVRSAIDRRRYPPGRHRPLPRRRAVQAPRSPAHPGRPRIS
ncbi:hypothetical protein QT196_39085 (plasmid) [Streptomyces sp. P9-2B-2]|uniref:hypothetical protein n=1 Tax=Streptomyces sp. P9-2B-2 TaxID=3057114 RepID=UPI0025B30259|nr:hypothetical protein [Streptomyces sp. P9-2B-2]WJY43266.1 hypothetical protein QT196_39085 [Streptomyces sp. P9-2B-2]